MATQHPLFQTLVWTSSCTPLLIILFNGGSAATATLIHDLLQDHGLPAGLLPITVPSFTLDQHTGLLQAQLDVPCYARWHDNRVFFDRVVAGNLSYGELSGVVWLSQEELFLCIPVRAIAVADPSWGFLLPDISLALKQLSLWLFEYPPDCQVPACWAGETVVPGPLHGPE